MLAPWWLVGLAAAAILTAAVTLVRSRPAPAVASADLPLMGEQVRRSVVLRGGIVAVVGGTLAASYLLAPRPTGALSSLVSSGRNTVVVLDMSQSVSDLVYQEIARTLEGIVTAAGDTGRVGLVLFSDTAQEALPPGSPAAALAPFISYFRPKQDRGVNAKPVYYRAAGPTEQILSQYPVSPWFGRFSGGTQISTGLRAARLALARHGRPARVVLVSDLQEADDDRERLTRELVAYERDPRLELRIVALPPATSREKALFWNITGERDAIVDSLALTTGNHGAGEPSRGFAWPFLASVLALSLALAAGERLGRPLDWRTE